MKNLKIEHFLRNDGESPKTAYMMVDGKLTEVEMVCTRYHDNVDVVESETYVNLPDGGQKRLPPRSYDKLYASVDDFKAGRSLAMATQDFYTICFSNVGEANESEGVIDWWEMQHGGPVNIRYEINSFDYDYRIGKFVLPREVAPLGRVYSSREECLSFNEFVSVKDGKETRHVGINKLLERDEDQRLMLVKLRNILKECEEHGLFLVMDSCEDIRAFNVRNVADYEMAVDDRDIDTDNPELYEDAKRYAPEFRTNINIPLWSDDATLFVKRKSDDTKGSEADDASKGEA